MKIQLNVLGEKAELNQANLHRIRRVANVLREANFEVEITFSGIIADLDDPMPCISIVKLNLTA